MKIATVIGARPQFVKAATLSRAIAGHNASVRNSLPAIHEVIVHTGQHFDANMSAVFFEEMHIPMPDYFLGINSISHGAMTGRMLEKIEEVLLKEKPDYVLVYGDTNSTLAGALAAKKLYIKVVHVESGLRSFNMRMPEEINRILTDRISDILCCPTETAIKNLQSEGFHIPSDAQFKSTDPLMVNTGDVMLDAALYYSSLSAAKSTIINDLNLNGNDFALCTIHRAENTDDPQRLNSIFAALAEIAKEMPVVIPLHPRTRRILASTPNDLQGDISRFTKHDSLVLIDPVGYFDMLELLKQTRIVLTDSGGLQKEAYFFHKPCVTLRDETEWIELIEEGANVLAGSGEIAILACFDKMKDRILSNNTSGLYGNGHASAMILKHMLGA